MRPKTSSKKSKSGSKQDVLSNKFPGLAIPNDAKPKYEIEEEEEKMKHKYSSKEEIKEEQVDDDVFAAMAELEALAPSSEKCV